MIRGGMAKRILVEFAPAKNRPNRRQGGEEEHEARDRQRRWSPCVWSAAH
jgi:hypothetical protein